MLSLIDADLFGNRSYSREKLPDDIIVPACRILILSLAACQQAVIVEARVARADLKTE